MYSFFFFFLNHFIFLLFCFLILLIWSLSISHIAECRFGIVFSLYPNLLSFSLPLSLSLFLSLCLSLHYFPLSINSLFTFFFWVSIPHLSYADSAPSPLRKWPFTDNQSGSCITIAIKRTGRLFHAAPSHGLDWYCSCWEHRGGWIERSMHHSFLFGAASLPVPGPIWKLALYILWSFILLDLLHKHHQLLFPLRLCLSLSPDTFSVNYPPFYLSAALSLEISHLWPLSHFPLRQTARHLCTSCTRWVPDWKTSYLFDCLGFHPSVRPPREGSTPPDQFNQWVPGGLPPWRPCSPCAADANTVGNSIKMANQCSGHVFAIVQATNGNILTWRCSDCNSGPFVAIWRCKICGHCRCNACHTAKA